MCFWLRVIMKDIKLDGFIKFVDEKLSREYDEVFINYLPFDLSDLPSNGSFLRSCKYFVLNFPASRDSFYKDFGYVVSQFINIREVKDTIIQTLTDKNHDYSNQNDIYAVFEYTNIKTKHALIYELQKKAYRINNLLKDDKTPQNESIKDNLLDLLGYRLLLDYWLFLKNESLKNENN